jgi:phosphoglucomutase
VLYDEISDELGPSFYARMDAKATAEEKGVLKSITPSQLHTKELASEPLTAVLTHAPGNGEPIGGIKMVAKNGWFAARPSGTEDVYKIYAESFKGEKHLQEIQREAQALIAGVFAAAR